MAKKNNPKKHHYVPQFYLRQFSCPEDSNKVPTISNHAPFLIKKKSSIARIGYENNLYRIMDKNIDLCIEKSLNKTIETPISQSETWEKIKNGKPELLNENDKLVIYIFMRHLESRNIEILEFLKNEQVRIKNPKYRKDYSNEERRMHDEITNTPQGVNQFYLGMSNNTTQYLEEYKRASISIVSSCIPIRTSTNPVINVPSHAFENKDINPSEMTKWLPLTPKFGAMLFLNDSYCDFGELQLVEKNVVRVLNRIYLVQLLNSYTTRHMIASDNYLLNDFEWSGVKAEPSNPRKFRIST